MINIIGPSTGWLYAIGTNTLEEQEKIIKEANANAFEISFEPEVQRIRSLLNGSFNGFKYRSMHLPEIDPAKPLEAQLGAMKSVISKHKIETGVIHPCDVSSRDYWRRMVTYTIPVAAENMDKNKPSGFKPPTKSPVTLPQT